jgi:hypothetical protein
MEVKNNVHPCANVPSGIEPTHATVEELLEAAFSVWSVLRLYNEGQLPLEKSVVATMRRVGVSTEAEDIVGIRHQTTNGKYTSD